MPPKTPNAKSVANEHQLALFPATAEEQTTPSLAALVQTARVESATAAEGGAVGALLHRLLKTDGMASVEALRAEGFPEATVVAAITGAGLPSRARPRVRLGIVGGEPFIWLTTTGFQSCGKPSGRERTPDAEGAEHAIAPTKLARWLRTRLAPHQGLTVSVATGTATADFQRAVAALAWGRIQSKGDPSGALGSINQGIRPDAVMVERFPSAQTYLQAWGISPADPLDLAEQTVALEIEDSRKADHPLRAKVERWDTALDLGAAFAVVWVVRSAKVAERLQALGVGGTRPRQLLVAGADVGLGGDKLDLEPVWWPLRLAPTGGA